MKSPIVQPTQPSAKPVLAIDIDDVLGQHYDILIDFFNLIYDLKLDHERLRSGVLKAVDAEVDLPSLEIIMETERFMLGPGFSPRPLPQAIEAINKLKAHYQLVVITARGDFLQDKTWDWLNQHFPKIFNSVRFVGAIGWGRGFDASKVIKLKELGAAIFIDDNLRHCTDAAALGVKALLFGDYSWNRADNLPEGVVRVKDWPAVERLLLP